MLPAITIIATPGRRRAALEAAQEAERRGFAGIYMPSPYEGMGFAEAVAIATERAPVGTTIANIYSRHASEYALTAAMIHELSGGRFVFGIGVSHGPTHAQLGITPGKPLTDIRNFVRDVRATWDLYRERERPPIVLATLRNQMLKLAAEIGDGAVWANASCSAMPASLAVLPDDKRTGGSFFIGNMIPTCISDDRAAAANVMRRMLTGYVQLPNYQNYWIAAGYEEEMTAIRQAIADGDRGRLPELMSERWLKDVTLYGSAAEVRDGVDRWRAAGVTTPILVPSSAGGNQMKAIEEVFAAFA